MKKKMKKPNKHVMRLVAATTATSMLLPACEPFINNAIVISEDLPARGKHAIDLDLSRAELNYLLFLQRLSNDIVRNPMIAQAFARNPQLFLEQYGFHQPIDLDEGMLRLVLTLGDQDINRAMNAGDIRLVLKLMEEKGFLNDLANSHFNLSNISEGQAREILLAMGFDESEVEYLACTVAWSLCAVLAVVAVVAAVVVEILLWGVAVDEIAADDNVWATNGGSKLLESNLPLRIWSLKGKPSDTYIAVNMYVEDQINRIIDLVKSNNTSFNENKMRDFLKLNIMMQSN